MHEINIENYLRMFICGADFEYIESDRSSSWYMRSDVYRRSKINGIGEVYTIPVVIRISGHPEPITGTATHHIDDRESNFQIIEQIKYIIHDIGKNYQKRK